MVNVNDMNVPRPTGDRLIMIFERQHDLVGRYRDIERKNKIGLGMIPEGYPFDIDDSQWQYLLKDYAWRITEEITESTEVTNDGMHKREEAADALHFLVEMYLTIGFTAEDVFRGSHVGAIVDHTDMLGTVFLKRTGFLRTRDSTKLVPTMDEKDQRSRAYAFIETIGCAMNCLKNKPWKTTQMETDVARFCSITIEAFGRWVDYAYSIGMDDHLAYDLYFRKSNVNKFRQRSNY